jgi:large subunit ribosomal protein L6
MPIPVPNGVEVNIDADTHLISVKGPLGTLRQALNPLVKVAREGTELQVSAADAAVRQSVALSGTFRALIANMVQGVTKGFERRLNLVGTGYRAQSQGAALNLSLGFSHPVVYTMPEGVKAETPTQTEIVIKGTDRQKVGQVAAEIRAFRPPEPYKGKGVRYSNEKVALKEVKKKSAESRTRSRIQRWTRTSPACAGHGRPGSRSASCA